MRRTLLATAFGLLLSLQAQAAALVFEPSSDPKRLAPGDQFTLTLKTDASVGNLMGGVFDLHYNADVLGYQGADFAPMFALFKNDQAARGVGRSGETTITDISFSDFFNGTGGGSHALVTLKFAALAPGASEVSMNPGRTGFSGPGMVALSLDLPDPLEVVVTPVPAALPLLATALAGVALLRRRPSRQA